MGSITKEISARNCTRINFSRAAHINCYAYVILFFSLFSSPFAICCLLCSVALEEYNITRLLYYAT